MPQRTDFISAYLAYIGQTEAPCTFHRWSCIAILGAWLGRRYSFKLGHFNINSNMYVMLMGGAGSRKTTAIKLATSLLRDAGYTNIAAERSSKEKLLMDLAGEVGTSGEVYGANGRDIMDENLFGKSDHVSEILIAADEFNIFVGTGNIEFLSLLGVLWDYNGKFEDRKKNSKSIIVTDPTVSILAGNTATGFSLAFPAEAIGQGIFSRLILVHGEKTQKKITFPQAPPASVQKDLVDILYAIRQVAVGSAVLEDGARLLLDKIYQNWTGTLDVRFESYTNRRFTHLLKLCLNLSASALRGTITESDVLYANTILTHAEHSMPKALGEFGASKHSEITHKLIQMLENSYVPVSLKDLWKQLHNELEDIGKLKDILGNLVIAEKIFGVKGGFLAKRSIYQEEKDDDTVDFSMLSAEERTYIS